MNDDLLKTKQYYLALEYATKMHDGQFRKGGDPYITHPIAVSNEMVKKGFDLDYIITGLFHDLLEDTDATDDQILSIGGKNVLDAVKALTKVKHGDVKAYVEVVKKNPIAFEVKKADRLHNLQSCYKADINFIKKYITETESFYMDFSEEIRQEVKKLKEFIKDK